jgi:hypothetical protein
MDLLRLDTEAEPELPGTTLRMSPPRVPTEPRPHLPRDSSSTDAEPEPRVRVRRPVRREAGAAPAHDQGTTPGRSAAFKRLDTLYARCQGAKGNSPEAAHPTGLRARDPCLASEELESSTSKGNPAKSATRPGGSRITEAQRAAVMRLKAIGCDLRPPGYDSDESPPTNVRMVKWGGAGTDNGSLLLTVLATRAAPKFSGKEADWEAFAQDWATYRDILMEAEGGGYRRCLPLRGPEGMRRPVDSDGIEGLTPKDARPVVRESVATPGADQRL